MWHVCRPPSVGSAAALEKQMKRRSVLDAFATTGEQPPAPPSAAQLALPLTNPTTEEKAQRKEKKEKKASSSSDKKEKKERRARRAAALAADDTSDASGAEADANSVSGKRDKTRKKRAKWREVCAHVSYERTCVYWFCLFVLFCMRENSTFLCASLHFSSLHNVLLLQYFVCYSYPYDLFVFCIRSGG